MNILTKISVVVLVLLVVISSVVFITMATQVPNYRDLYEGELERNRVLAQETRHANVALRRSQMETAREKARADTTDGRYAADTAALRRQLDDEKRTNVENKTKLASVELALKRIGDELKAKEERNQALDKQLDQERAEKNTLAEQFRTTNDKLNQEKLLSERWRTAAESLRQDVAARDEDIRRLTELLRERGRPVAAGPDRDTQPPPVPGITGTVTAVAGDVASINVGSIKGIKPGMEMMIYRGREFVAYLQVQDVDDSESSGVVVKKRLDPMIGDKVESTTKER